MSATVIGRTKWGLQKDREGHRNYSLQTYVYSNTPLDGPLSVLSASGLPVPGAYWAYGNDSDPWAYCSPEARVEAIIPKEPNQHWLVDQTFTTFPFKRCQDSPISDPLAEPPGVSGSFVRWMKRGTKDRRGKAVLSSSHEPIRGLEKDANRPSVQISVNQLSLNLDVFSQMIDTLNDSPLWGLASRKIKLSNAPWQRKLYGSCSFYYTITYEFEIRYDGFDEIEVADTGFKHYNPLGTASGGRSNPRNFINIQDPHGGRTPTQVLLNGSGDILDDVTTPHFHDPIEWYSESNFLTLNIPTYF